MPALVPPDPPLRGRRVALRPFRSDDAAAVARACRDPDILRYTMMPDGIDEQGASDWIATGLAWWPRGLARFAITVAPHDDCLGQVGVQLDLANRRAESFYWLLADARGAGLAAEALELVTDWVFRDVDVVRMQLVTHVDNHASQRLAERCGFHREGILRAWEPIKGRQPDVVMFSRLPDDPRPRSQL